jgi:hypothetical protein
LRALSGGRRDRLQTPVRSVAGAAFCAFATAGFSGFWARTNGEQTKAAATARIELTNRLRIQNSPCGSDSSPLCFL